MPQTFFGFYDLDASGARGVSSDLATRLGGASQGDGFIQGCLYVRSDAGGVAAQLRYDGPDDWAQREPQATLLQAAQWRSRNSDGRNYRLVDRLAADRDAIDSSFFAIQRFDTNAETQKRLIAALHDYYERFGVPIEGFVSGETYASGDGARVIFLMAWEHEAALNALENAPGSLAAMQMHLGLATRHEYGSYERVSRLGDTSWERIER